jgi:hypothetical protein
MALVAQFLDEAQEFVAAGTYARQGSRARLGLH